MNALISCLNLLGDYTLYFTWDRQLGCRNPMRNISDNEMLLKIARNFGILFFVLFMFDSIVDLLLWAIDTIIELIHLGIEAIEYSVEIFLENTFHTDHFQSELIIVNTAIVIALFILYRLFFAIPRLYIRYKRKLKAAWLRSKRRRASYWRSMSTICKIKWVSAYSFGITCLTFLVTI